ncbi:outer membrane protein assembly factor BamD [Polluticoccus soli]|uniref:outer membrane protein assembly factor BamD n=1 Tax=Polluticoccus soli TaxID=3034150 RepID=UPI0023E1510D|nr:outer membrane protein assembly factor BamD [Flavipsychrobacter sp. JY13-12]
MLLRVRNLFILLAIAVSFAACNSYEKVLKSNDVNFKLTKANQYYDKKQYAQAIAVYENLIPVMKNTKNYEPMYYRYAWSYYNLKDYLSASYHFRNFVDFFPNSKDAEDMEYMHSYALYKLSPKPSLEQTNTIKALEAMQSFINTHPESKRVAEANKIIFEGRQKLETKDADAAKLYYNIGHYKAAGVAYKNLLRNYPESAYADFYHYMIVRAWYRYAKASITTKQEERYASAVEAYKELVDTYPKSTYLRDAEKVFTLADYQIKKIRNEHK